MPYKELKSINISDIEISKFSIVFFLELIIILFW